MSACLMLVNVGQLVSELSSLVIVRLSHPQFQQRQSNPLLAVPSRILGRGVLRR